MTSELHSVQRVLQRVPLENAGPARRRLDIELPASELTGQVVDQSGESVFPALVRIESLADGASQELKAREDGTFEVHGLSPGRVRIRALGPQSASRTAEIEVSSEQPAFVRLTVEPQNRVSGRVMSAAGPVAGAVVYVLPAPPGASVVPRAATDAEGRFDAALPAGVAEADVFVAPPGFAARMFRTRIAESVIVPVSQVSGTLVVRFERSPDEGAADVLPFLRHAGATVNVRLFLRPGSGPVDEGKQRTVRIGELEPGAYEVCRQRDRPPCAAVVVAPFGVSTVTLP